VAGESVLQTAKFGVPNSDGVVAAASQDQIFCLREIDAHHRFDGTRQRRHSLSSASVPDLDVSVDGRSGEERSQRVVSHVSDLSFVSFL